LYPEFHPDSYGYRPEKSAKEAVGQARKRCWRFSWVCDLDIKGFFDNIDHVLMLRAVRKHTDCPWVLLYIERWLQAPGVDEDGQRVERDRGTPQGGVISPLLANIFLHHVLDKWMAEHYPTLPFERYADDVIVHCRSKRQARFIRHRIEERLQQCKLELHPQKTKIVFCKKNGRSGSHEHLSFDFLGFTFQPRMARSRDGELFLSFLPAISERAATAARRAMRDWGLQRRSECSLEELAQRYGATLRGWIEYYGSYGRWRLSKVFTALNNRLVRWAQRKYKRYRRYGETLGWLRRIAKRNPSLFPHWEAGFLP
jgi:RNA-directed DNA polymerase